MPRNGSGSYALPSGNPVTTGTTISSTVQNNTLSDIATALTQSLAKDGQTTPTANLPMGGFKLTGLASGSARTDSASIANIQDGTGFYSSTVGGTSDVITLTPSPAFVAYTAGQLISFISSGANTTNVTVNISGLGAKAVTKNGATALVAGDIPASALIHLQYDGTQFQLVNVNVNPLSSITGLGTGVATFLGTPSSANLASAVTDETGSGALVFANTPTLVTPILGTPTSGTLTNCTGYNSITLGTSQPTTSGTSIEFTSIPSGVKRITMMFDGVSTNAGGSNLVLVQLGSTTYTTTGYDSEITAVNGATTGGTGSTAGFAVAWVAAANTFSGLATFVLMGSNTWVYSSICRYASGAVMQGAGRITISSTLDRIKLLTANGTDTFDAGNINIQYES